MRHKIIMDIIQFVRKASSTVKHDISLFKWKYGIKILKMKIFFSLVLAILLIGAFIFYIYKSIGVIEISNSGIILHNFNFLPNDFQAKDIVTTQISVTLIVTSIIALIATVENKYILGVRAIEYVFPGKTISLFTIIFILIFASMFLNIVLLIRAVSDTIIFSIFILSIACIAGVSYRFASIFIKRHSIINMLTVKYYKGNLKHLRKAKPTKINKCKDLEDFKFVTNNYIQTSELQYSENIEIYFLLIKYTLHNNFKLVQKYYTESISHSDVIAHVFDFAHSFIFFGKQLEAIRLYNRLMSEINYYKLVLVKFYKTMTFNTLFIYEAKNTKTEAEAIEWHREMWRMLTDYLLQVYFFSQADFSYCRLFEYNMIYYFPSNTIISDYYLAIRENDNLNKKEKSRIIEMLFDDLRMNEFYQEYPQSTIENYRENNFITSAHSFPLDLNTEPIVMLFLSMFENKDTENLKLFMHMNISRRLMCAVRTICLLSIVTMLARDNRRVYYLDLKMNSKRVIDIICKCEFIFYEIDCSELVELYNMVANNYMIKSPSVDSTQKKNGVFSFHPKLSFESSVVNTLFYHLAYRNNIITEFQDKIGLKLVSEDKVSLLINQFYDVEKTDKCEKVKE